MKEEISLVNKQEMKNTINFSVWADSLSGIEEFIEQVQIHGVEHLPESMKYKHEASLGYWINISLLKEGFDKVIEDIKYVFQNNERYVIVANFETFRWIQGNSSHKRASIMNQW